MTEHSAPTQGDLEAAADYLERTRNMPCHYGDMREGLEDDHRLVQAFAAHRLAAIEECAKAIEQKHANNVGMVHSMAVSDAQAIRNLGRGA